MRVAPLAAFVLGVCALQWQVQLPSWPVLFAAAAAGLVAALVSLRMAESARAGVAMACAAAFLLGFGTAGGRAQLRMADELPFADEGRDLAVTSVVASLPVRLERGVRFEFDVEQHERDVAVPGRVLLGWYADGEPVRPGERWRFVVRLGRPHGAMNPGGFDFVRTDHAGATQWRYGPDGTVETCSSRAIAVRYWHNRPGAGRAVPAAGDDEPAGEGELCEPYFGMP